MILFRVLLEDRSFINRRRSAASSSMMILVLVQLSRALSVRGTEFMWNRFLFRTGSEVVTPSRTQDHHPASRIPENIDIIILCPGGVVDILEACGAFDPGSSPGRGVPLFRSKSHQRLLSFSPSVSFYFVHKEVDLRGEPL